MCLIILKQNALGCDTTSKKPAAKKAPAKKAPAKKAPAKKTKAEPKAKAKPKK